MRNAAASTIFDDFVRSPRPPLRGAKRRGNLLAILAVLRLPRFARNDKPAFSRLFASPSILVLLLLLFQLLLSQLSAHVHAEDRGIFSPSRAFAPPSVEKKSTDIEWFKKETGISPKYTERESGMLGLTWSHFLTMVFLIISIVVVVVAVILRYRRTKELLALMLKEGSQNDGGG